jgi:hypothetical protein
MWLFTRYGFYSIVCARTPDGSTDVETVMVRSRSADHLRRLQERFPALEQKEIVATPGADYPCRMAVAKSAWASILYELTMEMDWTNFRNEVTAYQGATGRHYLEAVHDVWDRMAHL